MYREAGLVVRTEDHYRQAMAGQYRDGIRNGFKVAGMLAADLMPEADTETFKGWLDQALARYEADNIERLPDLR